MKAALLTRVSTQEQAAEGYSLAAQLEKLEAYAKFNKYEVYDVYKDEGFSGASLNRPGLVRLINDVKTGHINIVLIYKLDRLSRRVKDVLELVELFEQYNVTLYSLTESLDLSSPFGRAALKMSATFSELERETIIERSKLGKEQRVKQGRAMCPGKVAPFGYKRNVETKGFDIVPAEAEMVRKLFELYIGGMAFRKLYAYARENFNHPYFSHNMSCKPIIRRAMYSGYFSYKGELYKGTNFEPIVDLETYLKAQKQLEKNRTTRTRDNSPYLLTGLVVCTQCGNRYVGKLYDRYSVRNGKETKRYKYTAYGCAARVKPDRSRYTGPGCKNEIYDAGELEQHVERYILKLRISDFVDSDGGTGLIDALLSENAKAKAQIEKLLDLYMSELIDKDTYAQRIAEYEKTINKNKGLIEQEKQSLTDRPTTSINYLKERLKEYPTASKNEKRRTLRHLIKHIAIDGEKINIKWKVK